VTAWFRTYFSASATSAHHSTKLISGLSAPAVLCAINVDVQVAYPSLEATPDTGSFVGFSIGWGIATVDAGAAEPAMDTDANVDEWFYWGGLGAQNLQQLEWAPFSDNGYVSPVGGQHWEWRGVRRYTASRDWWLEILDFGGNHNRAQAFVSLGFYD
jgi:hypothetical protein